MCMMLQIHLIGGYQIWTQPFLSMVENSLEIWLPDNKLMHAKISIPVPKMGTLRLPIVRLVWRSIYVCILTFVAILAPFFNDIVGKHSCILSNVYYSMHVCCTQQSKMHPLTESMYCTSSTLY